MDEHINIFKCLSYNSAAAAKSLQSYPTLCDPTDCSLPGSSVHGILQARILEWVAISFSKSILGIVMYDIDCLLLVQKV